MNTQSLLPHALWAVIAAGAFAGGQYFNKSRTGAANGADGGAATPAGQAAGSGASAPWKSAGDTGSAGAGDNSTSGGEVAMAATIASGPLTAEAMSATLADILKEADPIKRNRLFAELLEKLTPENAQAAVDAMREGGLDPMNFRDIALLSYSWGKLDPEKAMAYASASDLRGRAFLSSSILAGWASQNPTAAMEWFKAQNANGFEKNIMARGLIEGLIQTDLNAATRLATAESDPELKGQFFDAIARQQLKAGGAQAAKDWMSRLLAGGTVPADSLAGTAGQVADRLARTDPKAAAAWAMSLPEGEARNNAMEESISQWGRSDPTAASEYLTRMPASDAKDRAVQDFSGSSRRRIRNRPSPGPPALPTPNAASAPWCAPPRNGTRRIPRPPCNGPPLPDFPPKRNNASPNHQATAAGAAAGTCAVVAEPAGHSACGARGLAVGHRSRPVGRHDCHGFRFPF